MESDNISSLNSCNSIHLCDSTFKSFLKKCKTALAGVAQWTEHQPVNQKVASSIPGQGTCLGCGPGPQLGACKKQLIIKSLAH